MKEIPQMLREFKIRVLMILTIAFAAVVIMTVHFLITKVRQGSAGVPTVPDPTRVSATKSVKPSPTDSAIVGGGEVGFEKWGKEFMLGRVNSFLSKVPFYGLPSELSDADTIARSTLEPTGAYLWLYVTNTAGEKITHRFRYQHGVLFEAMSIDSDILGSGRNPEIMESWRSATNVWSKSEAVAAFYNAADAAGLDPRAFEGKYKLVFLEDSFPAKGPDGKQFEVHPYYEVKFVDNKGETAVHARFRSDGGRWAMTYWANFLRTPSEDVSIDAAALRRRFWSNSN